jgi:hypothetical protein
MSRRSSRSRSSGCKFLNGSIVDAVLSDDEKHLDLVRGLQIQISVEAGVGRKSGTIDMLITFAALNCGCSGINWDGNCLAYLRFLIGGLFYPGLSNHGPENAPGTVSRGLGGSLCIAYDLIYRRKEFSDLRRTV